MKHENNHRFTFYGLLPVSILVLLSLSSLSLSGQCIKMATWNIQDLGKTKDAAEVFQMARILRDFDFVAIQEVVAIDPAGAQKVAAIVAELDRMGSNWDYKISPPTTCDVPQSRERYAFLWKTSKLEVLSAELDDSNEGTIVREPYLAKLRLKGTNKDVWVANFHSLPHGKHPETEILLLKSYFPAAAPFPLVLSRDWNLNEEHVVWRSFDVYGLTPIVRKAPTTLKRVCKDGVYHNYAIDNIYYPAGQVVFKDSGVFDFVDGCDDLSKARRLSDHLVVWGLGCF